jgi:hypothetical protein
MSEHKHVFVATHAGLTDCGELKFIIRFACVAGACETIEYRVEDAEEV